METPLALIFQLVLPPNDELLFPDLISDTHTDQQQHSLAA